MEEWGGEGAERTPAFPQPWHPFMGASCLRTRPWGEYHQSLGVMSRHQVGIPCILNFERQKNRMDHGLWSSMDKQNMTIKKPYKYTLTGGTHKRQSLMLSLIVT
jgi:hypothetical protein